MSFRLNHIALWLFVGGLVSYGVGLALHHRERAEIAATHVQDVEVKVKALQRELVLHFEVLHMLAGLYDASENVSREEFSRISRDALARNPTIQALEWVPRVPEAERVRWEEEAGRVFPGFQFTALMANSQALQPAREGDYFYPVYYLEPLAGNEAALGFDLGSNPVRRAALETARDTAELAATAGLHLVQLGPEEHGFLAMKPVYHGMPTTLESRRQNLYGYVLGVFRINRLMQHAVNTTGAEGLHLRLLDITDREHGHLLFESGRLSGDQLTEDVVTRDIHNIGGRSWRLVSVPYQRYVQLRSSDMPYWVAGALLGVVLLFAFLMRVLQQQNRRIQEEVERRTEQLNEANVKLEELSRTDPLTGVANRRAFDQYAELEWRRSAREKTPFALMLIDIDYFKKYNDFYGHQAGDLCLRNVAGALQSGSRRASDLLARYGGEEFAMVVPKADNSIDLFGEVLRATVESLQVPHLDTPLDRKVVTVSVGVATTKCAAPDQFARFLRCADEALYEAKRTGRNKVVCREFVE